MSTELKGLDVLGGLQYGAAPEAYDDVEEWLSSHPYHGHFINGEFIRSANRNSITVVAPSNNEFLAKIFEANAEDVDAAMNAAQEAFPKWNGLSCHERARYLYAIARAIAKHSKMLARLESLNNGKPIRESRDADIPAVIRHFYNHAGWAQLRDSEFPNCEPKGVIAQIIPWNFPLLMFAWKVAPAIAAGNTVVIKPAEFTPLTAMLLANILKNEVKLPPGVINIVNGGAKTGKLMVQHSTPWKVAFTGSTEVGRWIRKETAGSGKKLTMELGGKSPFIVFEDADLDSAVEGLIDAIFFNYGQVCCAGSRLLIQESIHDKVISKLKIRMMKLRGGKPLDKSMDLGAVNSLPQLEKIKRLMKMGEDEGAEVWQPANWVCSKAGYHYPPTLVTNVEPTNTLAREEVFGPVLTCMTFRTPKEAIDLANNTAYGLAASIWTQDVSLIGHVNRRIKAGTIWNNCTNLFDAASGFGGFKESGYGREGGREGMREVLVEVHQSSEIENEVEMEASKDGLIDRTYRFFIDGKLARPDGGTSFSVNNCYNELLCVTGNANEKDARNAVEAARKAQSDWEYKANPHLRAQILYFLAENLEASSAKFMKSFSTFKAHRELKNAIEIIFHFAALADKFEGAVQPVPIRGTVTAHNEPIGVIGIRAPDKSPLLGFVSLMASAISMGNTVVMVAGSRPYQALELIQVIQNSDIPAGVVNILTAEKPDTIAEVLAGHKDVDAIWYFGSSEGCAKVERASISNMKRAWALPREIDWYGTEGKSKEFLRQATQIKNIWTPDGV